MTEIVSATDDGPESGFFGSTYKLAWQAILLREEAYTPMRETAKPFWHGFWVLLLLLLSIALAQAVGMVFDVLTLPRLEVVQSGLYDLIVGSNFYQNLITEFPALATLFDLLYNLAWLALRFLGGYPSWPGVLLSFINIVIFGMFNWITYGLIAYWVGRWLGGSGQKSPFFGALALAYAPGLLAVANIIPGLTVPYSLIGLWILATSYQAIRSTHKLSWGRTVLTVILPYFIVSILLYASVYLGIALGLAVYQRIV